MISPSLAAWVIVQILHSDGLPRRRLAPLLPTLPLIGQIALMLYMLSLLVLMDIGTTFMTGRGFGFVWQQSSAVAVEPEQLAVHGMV